MHSEADKMLRDIEEMNKENISINRNPLLSSKSKDDSAIKKSTEGFQKLPSKKRTLNNSNVNRTIQEIIEPVQEVVAKLPQTVTSSKPALAKPNQSFTTPGFVPTPIDVNRPVNPFKSSF